MLKTALSICERRDCEFACRDSDMVFQLAADMGGMGYIETHRAACTLNVLINTNMLLAARDAGVQRYFFRRPHACTTWRSSAQLS